jgi:hypothetical protein
VKSSHAFAGALAVALPFAACVAGCSTQFEPSYRVSGLRVLAVRADQPYAPPGATVHMTTLAFDTESRPLTWGWGTCEDPPSSEVVDCIDGVDWSSFTVAPGADSHDVLVPADALSRLPAAVQPRATLGVLVVTCPGDLSVVPSPPGVRATGALPFVCKDAASGRVLANDEYQVGVKRIFVRATDRNANPVISGVVWDGKPWDDGAAQQAQACDTSGNVLGQCGSGLTHQVGANAASGSAESGVDSYRAGLRRAAHRRLLRDRGDPGRRGADRRRSRDEVGRAQPEREHHGDPVDGPSGRPRGRRLGDADGERRTAGALAPRYAPAR